MKVNEGSAKLLTGDARDLESIIAKSKQRHRIDTSSAPDARASALAIRRDDVTNPSVYNGRKSKCGIIISYFDIVKYIEINKISIGLTTMAGNPKDSK